MIFTTKQIVGVIKWKFYYLIHTIPSYDHFIRLSGRLFPWEYYI